MLPILISPDSLLVSERIKRDCKLTLAQVGFRFTRYRSESGKWHIAHGVKNKCKNQTNSLKEHTWTYLLMPLRWDQKFIEWPRDFRKFVRWALAHLDKIDLDICPFLKLPLPTSSPPYFKFPLYSNSFTMTDLRELNSNGLFLFASLTCDQFNEPKYGNLKLRPWSIVAKTGHFGSSVSNSICPFVFAAHFNTNLARYFFLEKMKKKKIGVRHTL